MFTNWTELLKGFWDTSVPWQTPGQKGYSWQKKHKGKELNMLGFPRWVGGSCPRLPFQTPLQSGLHRIATITFENNFSQQSFQKSDDITPLIKAFWCFPLHWGQKSKLSSRVTRRPAWSASSHLPNFVSCHCLPHASESSVLSPVSVLQTQPALSSLRGCTHYSLCLERTLAPACLSPFPPASNLNVPEADHTL